MSSPGFPIGAVQALGGRARGVVRPDGADNRAPCGDRGAGRGVAQGLMASAAETPLMSGTPDINGNQAAFPAADRLTRCPFTAIAISSTDATPTAILSTVMRSWMMPDATVLYSRDGPVASITLNRPAQHNAVDLKMAEELGQALERFDFDEKAQVAILSGNGPDFCVGIDVKQRFAGHDREERDRRLSVGPLTDGHLGRTANWKPVIGAVHGLSVGMGFNLALECDLLVAAEDSRFMIAETKRGIAAGQLWAKMQCFMPSKVTTELLLTGNPVGPEDLFRLGLINRLTKPGDHLTVARELADLVLANPPLAVRAHVRMTRWQWKRMCDEAALHIQPQRLHLTQDFEESASAFVEKRRPVFTAQ